MTCFGHDPLTIDGYAAGCDCGGATVFSGSPAWLVPFLGSPAFRLGTTDDPAADLGSLEVWVDPNHPVVLPRAGTHVAVTGHFDDPAAATCQLAPLVSGGDPPPDPADVVATCRRSFVASSIRVIEP